MVIFLYCKYISNLPFSVEIFFIIIEKNIVILKEIVVWMKCLFKFMIMKEEVLNNILMHFKSFRLRK